MVGMSTITDTIASEDRMIGSIHPSFETMGLMAMRDGIAQQEPRLAEPLRPCGLHRTAA